MKLKPRKMTEEQLNKVAEVTEKQTGGQVFKATLDGSEMFRVPVNDKVLVYVPNHTEVVDGVEQLRMDKPYLHMVKDGNSIKYIRCTAGAEELGYESCPMCENAQYHWDLARLQIEEACREQHLDPADTDSDAVKQIRSKFYGNRVLDSANRRFTFPIVVIDRKEKDEDGNPKMTPMWYSISERFFKRTWGAALKALQAGEEVIDFDQEVDEDDDSPIPNAGGRYYELDFTYDSKGKEHNRMQSALNLKVYPKKTSKSLEKLAEQMDKMTEDWDVAKCATTVVNNLFYDEEDMRALADEVTEPVKQRIELYEAKVTGLTPELETKNEDNKALEANKEPEVLEIDDNDLELL